MWWLAMICVGNVAGRALAKGPLARRLAGAGLRAQEHSHLPCGGDHEVQPINGDVDSDAHASEVQVALAQDGEQGFVGSLRG